jgi:hypothetical protein
MAIARQLNLGLRGSAVLHNVAQGLLYDPEEAQSDVLWRLCRNVLMGKLDLQVVLPREFSTVVAHSGYQPDKVQSCRVKLVRHVVKIARNF